MADWKDDKDLGPWSFQKQPNKWGYLNQPRWLATSRAYAHLGLDDYTGRENEEPQVWTPPDLADTYSRGTEQRHYQCGHWHVPTLAPPPRQIDSVIYGLPAINSRVGPHSRGVDGELFGAFLLGSNRKKLIVIYTTDYGDEWNTADDENAPVMTDIVHSFDSFLCEENLYIATQEETTGRVAYHIFSMSNRTWQTVNEQVVASVTNDGAYCVSIECRNPGLEPVVFFQGDQEHITADWQRGYYSIKQVGAWSAPVEVTPDPGVQPPYWGTESSNCYIQRVIAGNSNRMHFFWSNKVGDYVQRASGGEWSRTMDSTLAFAAADRRSYATGAFYFAPERNLGDCCLTPDRSKVVCARKVWGGQPATDVYYEAMPVAEDFITTVAPGDWIFEGLALGYIRTDFPSMTVRYSNGYLYACYASAANNNVRLARSSDGGSSWSSNVAIGPTYPITLLQFLFGTIVDIAGESCLAYFSGPWTETTANFRWLVLSDSLFS